MGSTLEDQKKKAPNPKTQKERKIVTTRKSYYRNPKIERDFNINLPRHLATVGLFPNPRSPKRAFLNAVDRDLTSKQR